MADIRHFDYYDKQNRLINQVDLHEELEKKGYEIKGKYILATKNIGSASSSLLGISIFTISSINLSILISCKVEIGIIGAFSAIVPLRNSLICL